MENNDNLEEVKTEEVETTTTKLTKKQKQRQREKLKRKKLLDDKKTELAKETLKNIAKEKDEKTEQLLLDLTAEMWKKLKQTVKEDPKFIEWEDKKKLAHFREDEKYTEFMNEYPVVSRYMICMGQFSTTAFKRFLNKIRMTVHPPAHERPKGYMEDEFVKRQADYVRYLYEAYSKNKHINKAESDYVWQDAYKNLKGEFDDFRDKYKEVEKNVKDEKVKLNASFTRDLLQRLKTGKQKLDNSSEGLLLQLLTNKMHKRNFSNSLVQMMTKVKQVEHCCEGLGHGAPETDETAKPKIRMIEHVAEDRIHEVPNHLIMNEEEVKQLPVIAE